MKPDKLPFICACDCGRLFHARSRTTAVCQPCCYEYRKKPTDGDPVKAEIKVLEVLKPGLVEYVRGDLIPPGFEKEPPRSWFRWSLYEAYVNGGLPRPRRNASTDAATKACSG